MSTTTLAFPPEPGDFDREWHRLIREVGATLADPLTPPTVRAAITATVAADTVFMCRPISPEARTSLASLNLGAGFGTVINPARRREVA
jgi:hypothetical protein